jgi:SAM-dependent methyltransferase
MDNFFDLVVPDCAVKYILLQRTELQRYFRTFKKIRFLYYTYFIPLEAYLMRQQIKEKFALKLLEEYQIMKPYLPTQASRIVDIGSGIAGIDVFLYHHYRHSIPKLDLFLLDQTETNKNIYYGFHQQASYYNSLEVAKLMLMSNKVNEENIHLISVNSYYEIECSSADLIISLISWGYHYPVSTYLEQVYQWLKPGGRLILDVRKGSDGENELKQKFPENHLIMQDKKRRRILLIKQ